MANDWTRVGILEHEKDRQGRRATLEINMRATNSGYPLFSCTPGIQVGDGDVRPLMHLRGDFLRDYLELIAAAQMVIENATGTIDKTEEDFNARRGLPKREVRRAKPPSLKASFKELIEAHNKQ